MIKAINLSSTVKGAVYTKPRGLEARLSNFPSRAGKEILLRTPHS